MFEYCGACLRKFAGASLPLAVYACSLCQVGADDGLQFNVDNG